MKIKIFFFGKKSDITETEKELQKRIQFQYPCEFIILPQAGIKGTNQIQKKEADTFFQKIDDSLFLIACDQHGKEYDSQEFSHTIMNALEVHREIAFVIGGAYGLSEKIIQRANLTVRFGKMVWTKSLFRIMLCEQIYRAIGIDNGSNFHK